MPLDVAALRAETPGCATVTHLNNAGASLAPQPVLDAVVGHLHREATIGGYEAAEEAADRLAGTYASVAALLGATADEVALTDSCTRGYQLALGALDVRPGARVLTARSEYPDGLDALRALCARTGARLEVVEDDATGAVDLEALERSLDTDVALVALTWVPTSGGLVNPAAEVGRLTREAGAAYVVDACQAVGQLPVDVRELGCDALVGTGRKWLRAPRGTGFLFVRRDSSGSQARDAELWERSAALQLGLAAAADYALALDVRETWARVAALGEQLRIRLTELPGVQVHDKGEVRGGIVTFSVTGLAAGEVRLRLREDGINTSVVHSATSELDLQHRGLPDLVRASVHYYNDVDELDRLVAAVAQCAN
ncbi:selenocysteine lyase/cysteine desulfurase [Motilibacter rhizosphaerae]|uniref:Selenocysteine lyase/cysteine desulfurase n=1 Tax=Motilibacter rhizosphaerae TaxID=598652 RepID=A0A4V2F4H1_9ACTN|nr:aminotransferase class V-fold PLP-dependent enzyme [Motilibacter rhizosphaerae]RZS87587.1 selenocysteine lyase/cysteine desulfurase [Motilibacter rhizosphaerae]